MDTNLTYDGIYSHTFVSDRVVSTEGISSYNRNDVWRDKLVEQPYRMPIGNTHSSIDHHAYV